jgi:hypothetical protein
MKTKTKSVTILIVVMLVVISALMTGVTYAYWNSLQTNETIELNLGEGTVISVNLDSNTADGKNLVPAGVLMGEDDVDSVSFTFTAALTKAAAQDANFSVSVVEGTLKVGGAVTHAGLINVSFEAPETITDDAEFTVTITMNEPKNPDEYNAIANKAVTFNIIIIAG